MFCPNCGSQIEENERFCSGCGTPITAQSNPSDTTPPPTPVQPTPTPLEGGQPIAATPLSTPATPESEQSAAATPAPIPTCKIVTLPSGKKIKVKNDKAQPATPPKERAPLTDLWAWLLATIPPFIWLILCWITNSWSVAFIGSGILTCIFALKDETALEKAGYRKEAPDFKLALALYPIFYLFTRAKRTNKNYDPAAISALLCIIATLIFYTVVQAAVSDLAGVTKGEMTEEEFEAKWDIKKQTTTKKQAITFDEDNPHETLFKLTTQIGLVKNGIMSPKEFEAQWGINLSEAIELVLDLERDVKRHKIGLMSEEEFEAKWIKAK